MTFNELCRKLFGRPWSDSGRGANPTVGSGLALALIFGVLMLVPGGVPVSIIAMDVVGEPADGRIIGHRDAWFSQRAKTVSVYAFRTVDGRRILADGAMETRPLPAVGSAVTVRYLPLWPEVFSKYGHHHYGHWSFWLFVVVFLPLAWMWLAVVRTTGRLILERSR